jgi:hypothetical protein
MTARNAARPLTLLAGLAILVAACGGPTATGTPGAPASSAPSAPATQAPVATSGTEPTFALPSFDLPSGDAELEGLLPDDLGGETVQKFSMTGDTFMGTQGNPAMQAVLDQYQKSPDDLSVAFGSTAALALFAYRLKGVDGGAFFDAFLAAAGEDAEVAVTNVSIGGKAVRKVVSEDPDVGTLYVYTMDDTMFIAGGDGVSDALLTEAFSKIG